MKKILHLSLFLAIVAAVAGGALSLTNQITAPVIAENERLATEESLNKVFPDSSYEEITDYSDETGTIKAIYKVEDKGYIYDMTVDGFGNDPIEFMVGFDTEGTIVGYSVISHSETKDIGSKITGDDFTNGVLGKTKGDEIDLISGATISSTAVRNGLNTAAGHYAANYLGK